MAESPESRTGFGRERTATRMRFVAPPGMSLDSDSELKTIGRYEIMETLGKGAMGVVYKARDPLLDRIVAVKTIVSPKHGGRRVRRAYLERFEREAKAAAKMQHPSIVTIFDVGSENGAPFMVLEYLPGESLADRLDRVRMPLGRCVQIGIDLASALGFAHKTRIVHRDVKPANVLHAGENRWKLADFGIARMPDSDLTQVGIFMGTPGYAPPEAIKQGSYTTQADVFAWGAVLYEVLSGRIAYEGPDTQTTNGYVIKATAPPPTHYDPSIPEPLSDVIMRALHPSTEERYKNGAEAEHALQKAWELCLASNLVSPAALVGKEVPHGKAPTAFHKGQPVADSPERPTSKSIGAAPQPKKAPTVLGEGELAPAGLDEREDTGEGMTVSAATGSARELGFKTLDEDMKSAGLTSEKTIPNASLSELKEASTQKVKDKAGKKKEAVSFEVSTQPPTFNKRKSSPTWLVLLVLAAMAGLATVYYVMTQQ